MWTTTGFILAAIALIGLLAPRIAALRPYLERECLAAFFLGISSGFPYALIGATLTTRLAEEGIDKKTVTAFSLSILFYNFKVFWAWVVDGVRLPVLGRLGQRVSWMLASGAALIAAVWDLGLVDPSTSVCATVLAAALVGIAGATFDIVIDAYRIETLKPHQLGTGSGMSQYGWRIGSAGAGALALLVSARMGWAAAYIICAALALPAIFTALVMGEPPRHHEPAARKGLAEVWASIAAPFGEFFRRDGAALVLLFILLHKIGDTLANLTFRLLFFDLKYTNDEIAVYDVGVGFWAYLVGVFFGGVAFARFGIKRSVLLALVLMGISNLGFAALAAVGHSNIGMACAIGFEYIASGLGGVVVVAYFSALCDLRFTASQYALISAGASVVGRLITGTTAGVMIQTMGYVDFYLFTTVLALPGIILFWWLSRSGLVDAAMGTAGCTDS